MFKRSQPTVTEAAATARWSLATGTHDGQPLVARMNGALAKVRDRNDYSIQIGVAVPLNDPDDRGLPCDGEAETLGNIEDLVVDIAGDRAVLVGVITTGSMREFILYTRSGDWIEGLHTQLSASVTTHRIDMMAQHDPDWTTYQSFMS